MKTLFILLVLLATPCLAEIKLKAPDTCVIGELIVFDALESDSEVLVWEIVPPTEDFKARGKEAFFSSRQDGDYLIIIAGSGPVLLVHSIHVQGSNSLDSRIKELLKKVVTTNGREEAIKLAQSFRGVTGTSITEILDATAKANRAALGDSLGNWIPFLDGLAAYLDSTNLESRDDYIKTWNAIADAIERHVK